MSCSFPGIVRKVSLADVGWFEFRRQLTYKAAWHGCEIVIADRFYPSTKRCSHCGQLKSAISLAERVYECGQCGVQLDRDWNAALNLEQWFTASSAGSDACGEAVRPGFPASLAEAGTEPQSALV